LIGTKITADFGLLGDGRTAVVEMARASGLVLVPLERRNPLHTTTFGTGELMAAPCDRRRTPDRRHRRFGHDRRRRGHGQPWARASSTAMERPSPRP